MLFVIIVNYRNAGLTVETVASLRRCPEYALLRVVIVDNGSADGSLERLRRQCADCTVLDAKDNLGFAGGNNVGIRLALAEGASRILLLNNDTEVRPNAIAELLAACDERTLVAPKILYADDPSRIWYGGGFVSYAKGGFYHETNVARADIPREVSFASGCCLMLPASYFKACGLLEEDYFLYYEDAALCLKARQAGFRICYAPQSVILHKVSASTGCNSPLTAYYGTRNRLAVMRRFYFPCWAFVFVLFSFGIKIIFRAHRCCQWRGLWDGLRLRLGSRALGRIPMARIVFNGVFVGRRVSGLERFALETLRALDGMVSPGDAEIMVPRSADLSQLSFLSNIRVHPCGCLHGLPWEQLVLPLYVWRRRSRLVSLTNTVPLLCPGVVCVHDVFYLTHARELGRGLRGRLSGFWHRLQYRRIARRSSLLMTVSNYSAEQITQCLGVSSERIVVLGNGWEHVRRVTADMRIFDRLPNIKRGAYLFILGNDMPYKNVRWALEQVKQAPELQLVVSGARHPTTSRAHEANVVYTGYVTDAEMRALMENCRTLLHPSLDEGFGIPPMEALALGRSAIVARRAGLPETYGSSVSYIDDPENGSEFVLSRLIERATSATPGDVLARHTWQNVAAKLWSAVVRASARDSLVTKN